MPFGLSLWTTLGPGPIFIYYPVCYCRQQICKSCAESDHVLCKLEQAVWPKADEIAKLNKWPNRDKIIYPGDVIILEV
jgi:hypothetical protein